MAAIKSGRWSLVKNLSRRIVGQDAHTVGDCEFFTIDPQPFKPSSPRSIHGWFVHVSPMSYAVIAAVSLAVPMAYGAGSFCASSGYLSGDKCGFSTLSDAGKWGWKYSVFAVPGSGGPVQDQSYAGIRPRFTNPADSSPPYYGNTNYAWAYNVIDIPSGLVFGPYPVYPIYYRPDVPPLSKNLVSDRCSATSTGHPVNIGSGDKFLVDVDWSSGNTAGLLPLRRYYHSTPDIVSRGSIGSQWRHTYDRSISVLVDTATTFVTALRQNGQTFSFILVNGQWVADADVPDKLTRLTDASGNLSGWQYLNSDDATESYDSAGKLVAIADRFGAVQTLTYDTANRLSVVSDAFGRKMLFTYDSQDRVAQVTDQANGLFRYAYDAADNLSSVTYPDGAVKIYLYPNSAIEFLTARQRGF